MEIDRLSEKAKSFLTYSARGILLVGAAKATGQLNSVEAADISSPETSYVYSYPTGTPLEIQTQELYVDLQGTPEPTPIKDVVDQTKAIIGMPEQFRSEDFINYVDSSAMTPDEKNALHNLVEDTKALGFALADNGWDQPLVDVHNSIHSNVQVTKLQGGVIVNGFVTSSSELTKNNERIEPGSLLVGYTVGSELKVNGIFPIQGQQLMFVPSVSSGNDSKQNVALISVFEDSKGLVTDGIAVFDPSKGQVVMESAARMMADTSGTATNLMEFPAIEFGDSAGTELSKLIKDTHTIQFAGNTKPDNISTSTTNASSVEYVHPSLDSVHPAFLNPEIISRPELIGSPTFLTHAEVNMPNGTPIDINIYTDIDMMKKAGFRLFQYTPESQAYLQKIAEEYIIDTSPIIPVLSVNNRLEMQTNSGLQNADTIQGESLFLADVTKVTVILTKDSLPEAVAFSAYQTKDGKTLNNMGTFIEPRQDGQLILYINPMGSEQDLRSYDKLAAFNFNQGVVQTLGYIGYFQNQFVQGKSSLVEMSSSFYSLRTSQTQPAGIIGKSKYISEIMPAVNGLVSTSHEIK